MSVLDSSSQQMRTLKAGEHVQEVMLLRADTSFHAELQSSAELDLTVILLGDTSLTCEIDIQLQEPHAVSNMQILSFATDIDVHCIFARNRFQAAQGAGQIRMHAVAQDTAQVQCNGMIDIGLQGGGTQAYLTQEVLMLDSTAKVDAVPGLEIKTNDVSASHSATIKKITEEDLFYFEARGMHQTIARRMYIEGFLGDLLTGLSQSDRMEINREIDRKYQAALSSH